MAEGNQGGPDRVPGQASNAPKESASGGEKKLPKPLEVLRDRGKEIIARAKSVLTRTGNTHATLKTFVEATPKSLVDTAQAEADARLRDLDYRIVRARDSGHPNSPTAQALRETIAGGDTATLTRVREHIDHLQKLADEGDTTVAPQLERLRSFVPLPKTEGTQSNLPDAELLSNVTRQNELWDFGLRDRVGLQKLVDSGDNDARIVLRDMQLSEAINAKHLRGEGIGGDDDYSVRERNEIGQMRSMDVTELQKLATHSEGATPYQTMLARAVLAERNVANQLEQSNNPFDAAYQRIKEQEAREPKPDDKINVQIKPTQQEWDTLISAGMDKAQLEQGVFTRQQLEDAGFFFLNNLGSGEKGIMSGTIPDPDYPTETIDFTNRVLLTREELEMIYDYQKQHPDQFGLQEGTVTQLDNVRNDMLRFMTEAVEPPAFSDNPDFVDTCLPYDRRDLIQQGMDDKQASLISNFWTDGIRRYKKTHPDIKSDFAAVEAVREEFAQTHCADIYTWVDPNDRDHNPFVIKKEIRGHQIEANTRRNGRLDGMPSPFLDSGFTFTENPDVQIWLNSPTGDQSNLHRRLNMGNFHIMGGHPDFPGLSEIGGSQDQIYMTIGEYMREFNRSDGTQSAADQLERVTVGGSRAELIKEVQARVLNAAQLVGKK